jgi:trimeric autotransporter adhesin
MFQRIRFIGFALFLTAAVSTQAADTLLTTGNSTQVLLNSTSIGGWFGYRGPTTAGGSSSETLAISTTHADYIQLGIDLLTAPYTYGGMGFTWQNAAVAADLSDYTGVCLAYTSTDSLTFTLSTSTTSKSTKLAAATTETVTYIPFTTFGWSTSSLMQQTQAELAYRTSGSEVIIRVYKMGLGETACGTVTVASSSSAATSSSSSIAEESSSSTTNESSSSAVIVPSSSSLATSSSSIVIASSSSAVYSGDGQVIWMPSFGTRVHYKGAAGGYWWEYVTTGITMTPTKPTTAANITTNKGIITEFKVTNASTDGAGVGFDWNTAKTAVDISNYSGVCIEYRNDVTSSSVIALRQKYVTDSDPKFLVALPKSTTIATAYVPFSSFALENWGTAYDQDLTMSLGFQFMSKKATTLGIYKLGLANSADDCVPMFEAALISSSSSAVVLISSSSLTTTSSSSKLTGSSSSSGETATSSSSSGIIAVSSSSAYLGISNTDTNPDSCTLFMTNLATLNSQISYYIKSFCADADSDGVLNWAEPGSAAEKKFNTLTEGIDLSTSIASMDNLKMAPTLVINNGLVTFTVPHSGSTRIDAFSPLGQHLTTIYDGMANGTQAVVWNTARLPQGTYFVSLSQGTSSQTIRYTIR